MKSRYWAIAGVLVLLPFAANAQEESSIQEKIRNSPALSGRVLSAEIVSQLNIEGELLRIDKAKIPQVLQPEELGECYIICVDDGLAPTPVEYWLVCD